MAIRERNCKRCDAVFIPLVSARRYCSQDCAKANYEDYRATLRKLGKATETINCRNCQTPFQRTNCAVWHCSGVCSVAARKARNIAAMGRIRSDKFEAARPGGLVICKRCAVEFKTTSLRKVYCGDECYNRRRSAYIISREAPAVVEVEGPAPLLIVACELPECGVDFQQTQASQRYCSILHRRRHTRRTSYRAEQGKPPIKSGKPSREEFQETMRDALKHLSMVHKAGFLEAGYTEAAPREATTPGPTGCPHCRAYGRDTLGRVQHSGWCREAALS